MRVKSGFLFTSRVTHTEMLPTAMQLGIYQSQHMKNANVDEHFFFFGGVGVKNILNH